MAEMPTHHCRTIWIKDSGAGLVVKNTPAGFVLSNDSGIAFKPGKVAPVLADFDGDGKPDDTLVDGNQIKLRNPRQGEKTVVVNDQTVFVKDGQPITLTDLKAGDRVLAMGKETGGQFVADRVMTGQVRGGGGPGAGRRERPEDH